MGKLPKTYYGSYDYTMTPRGTPTDFMQNQMLLQTNSKEIKLKKITWLVKLNSGNGQVPLETNYFVEMQLLINSFFGINIGAIFTPIAGGTAAINNFAIPIFTPGIYTFEKLTAFNDIQVLIRFDNYDLLNNFRVRTFLSIDTEE